MFYWVKSPDGEESDYNADELRKALEEGRVQPHWPARGNEQTAWATVSALLEQQTSEPEEPAASYASFVCGRCRNRLRLELPLKETAYSCPECATLYQCTKASEEPLVYVLMPDLKEYEGPAQGSAPPRKN